MDVSGHFAIEGKNLLLRKPWNTKFTKTKRSKHVHCTWVSIQDKDGERVLNIDKLWYHKIVVMCDADVMAVTLPPWSSHSFSDIWNLPIEQGFIYIAAPPLYQVKKAKNLPIAGTTRNELLLSIFYSKGKKTPMSKCSDIGFWERWMQSNFWKPNGSHNQNPEEKINTDDALGSRPIFSMLMGGRCYLRGDSSSKKMQIRKNWRLRKM